MPFVTLKVAATNASGTLTADATNSQDFFQLNNASPFPSAGGYGRIYRIDSTNPDEPVEVEVEFFTYTAADYDLEKLTGVTRGTHSSPAVTHATGSIVELVDDESYYNDMKGNIEDLDTRTDTLESTAISLDGRLDTLEGQTLDARLDTIEANTSGTNTGDEPDASTTVKGIIELATAAEADAQTSETLAVTPLGLASRVKGTTADTTIYVDGSTGNDTTGTGASGAPYATIAKAISSLPPFVPNAIEIAVSGTLAAIAAPMNFVGKVIAGSIVVKAKNTSNADLYTSGTVSSGTTTTLVVSGTPWTTNQWQNGYVAVLSGTGQRQLKQITSNTNNTLTVPTWTAPASGDTFIICMVTINCNGGSGVTLAPAVSWLGFRFTNTGTGYAVIAQACNPIVQYNIFDTDSNSISMSNVYSCSIWDNYFQIATGKYGLVLTNAHINIYRNCFTYRDGGSADVGTGILMQTDCAIYMFTGSFLNVFNNLSVGMQAVANCVCRNGSSQTFTSCVTTYTPADTAEKSSFPAV